MSQVFTLANHKGGVGKSSVCFGLADALEVLGRSVLVVDLDP
ncbi:MAG: ParA family protein, partial [Dehalococcoidia bacterium]|nr:ParA family protein [Dehalococcoidia bacterium]